MAALRWAADGIEAAEAAGGVTLETYRRPGFVRARGVRVVGPSLAGGSGFEISADPWPADYEPDDGPTQ